MGKIKGTEWLDRVLLHVGVGILAVLFCVYVHWAIGLIFAWGFLEYEKNDDRHTRDEAWKDIFGFLIGVGLAGVLIILYFLLRGGLR